eukprot:TRINITY_DN3547_c0_g1_i2.p2 TRINITY_DN3547_c0_g1~~TRINITY_DN3547_c0_g1_i2.p2  ORF type:complete len:186 (+),score=55.43 TRINITY_DN3547_c0_g1_i2:200-757(+)
MPTVSYSQAAVTGIGPGPDAADFVKSKNVLVQVRRDKNHNSADNTTTIQYVDDASAKPYQVRGERWSFAKSKTVSWVQPGMENALIKFSVDFSFGPCEMSTYGRQDMYHVVSKIRVSNIVVKDPVNVNIEIYSVIKEIRPNPHHKVEEMDIEVVVVFEGIKSGERVERRNTYLLTGLGDFKDIVV